MSTKFAIANLRLSIESNERVVFNLKSEIFKSELHWHLERRAGVAALTTAKTKISTKCSLAIMTTRAALRSSGREVFKRCW